MVIQIEVEGHCLVISIEGDLNETQSIALADRILNLCPPAIPEQVEINLSKCSSICSQGIGALVSFRLAPPISSSAIRISGHSPQIERQMRALKLDRLFAFAALSSTENAET